MLLLLIQLIPLALIGALMPTRFVVVVTLLTTNHPIANATAYWLGCTLGYLLVAALSGLLAAALVQFIQTHYREAGLLELALGLILLALSIRTWLRKPAPQSQAPGWLQRMESVGPPSSAAVGFLMGVASLRNVAVILAAVALVAQSGFGTPVLVLSLLLIVLIFSLPMVIPPAVYLRHRAGSTSVLAAARSRVVARVRPVALAVTALLGLYLVVEGITRL